MIKLKYTFIVLIAFGLLTVTSCDSGLDSAPDIKSSLELFTGLKLVPEADNTTLKINIGTDPRHDAFFSIDISDVQPNEFIRNTKAEAWCLEWNKPLRSNDDIHMGVKWYDTSQNTNWKPLNYLFSIRNQLAATNDDLTYREIQAVVWSLTGYMGIAPEFDVDKLSVSELPSRLRSNGKANFNHLLVKEITEHVLNNYVTAVVEVSGFALETAPDEQNVFVIPPSGVTTNVVTDITPTSAVSGGEISDAGDSPISQKGVCWSTSANPTTSDSCTNNGTGSDDFISNLTGLSSSTTYFVRAYAINEAGTAYGNQRMFTTESADEVTKELNVCGVWSASTSGGFGVTIDTWNIENIPAGATFDMQFDALNQPDKFVVEYPIGNEVHDTGWRGHPFYDGSPEFPGGVISAPSPASPGSGTALDMFEKGAQNTFRVVVTGPQQGTIWFYDIRCRVEL